MSKVIGWSLRATFLFAVALPSLLAGQGTSGAVSLERMLSAPFPTNMTSAPTGGSVAWVLNEAGARNIWIASPPAYQGRRLTSYTSDDGQELSSLTWAADAASIFYVRGGPTNRAGEVPNPSLDPHGEENALWRISVSGVAATKVGDAGDVQLSPRGDALIVTRGKIWLKSLGSSDTASRATLLVNVRGGLFNVRWSPDATKLAFVSNRGDHSFIGIYDMASKNVRFLSPSVDLDASPIWSPDSRRIAFVRTPSSARAALFVAERTGSPWSIMIGDATTGVAKRIFTADEGDGRVAHDVVADDQIMWGAGDRIVFPWEKDGWLHLYSVSADGGKPVLLTPGAFEVEDVALSNDRREVLFNSNQGDIDRRHLWRVGVASGPPVAITRGEGIEWGPTELSDGSIAYLRSDARTPAHAARIARGEAEGRSLAAVIPAEFPSASLVQPTAVTISASDGKQFHAQLFLPPGAKTGERHPAAIFFHGGSRRQMLLGFNYGEYYHNAYAMNQFMASRGYVVLVVNYRSGIGYGLAFREAEHYGASGASEFNDVVGAGLWLRARNDVDPARVAVWGGSYGGFLTAMSLARAPELFATGVDIHGVHDWNVGIRTFVPNYDTLRVPDFARLARASSPMAYLDRWKAPVLFIHGDDDRNVSFAETVTMIEQLRARHVEIEQLVLPDEVHGFLRHASWLSVYRATSEFLDRHLKQ
ncbi:MAG: prolyl oligopeptidase family serine peptidase [Gemmatimonadaceae bacterium]